MAGIKEEGGTGNEEFMDRMDHWSAAQSGPLSRGGIDLAGRLLAGVAPLALSSPARDPRSRRGAGMSGRLGPIAGLLMAILLAAGCASMSGLSTQATLKNA